MDKSYSDKDLFEALIKFQTLIMVVVICRYYLVLSRLILVAGSLMESYP
ncbi:hypothetical protein VCRA217O317_170105 [Vibrio crassostreae]|nr:hypothetical protein VCRA2110O319_160024 [Vibrio crassostreae]CAK2676635.1 hypothetical protein VCRA217O317_170105 [Vibrio crassostreae]